MKTDKLIITNSEHAIILITWHFNDKVLYLHNK